MGVPIHCRDGFFAYGSTAGDGSGGTPERIRVESDESVPIPGGIVPTRNSIVNAAKTAMIPT